MNTSIHVKEIEMTIYKADVQPGAKVLYFYLKENPGVHSQALLAYELNTTTQSINAYVKVLKKEGWLAVTETPNSKKFNYEAK